MIKTIRDDVINLEDYAVAVFKYDDELTLLYEVGGYALLMQLKNKYGDSKAKRLVKAMQVHNLISVGNYSNNAKFIYLTQNALKYLANKNNVTEKVNNIKKIVSNTPAEKVLISSFLKYELVNEFNIFSREKYKELLYKNLSDIKFKTKIIPIEALTDAKDEYVRERKRVLKLINAMQTKCEDYAELNTMLSGLTNSYNKKLNEYDKAILQSKEMEHVIDLTAKPLITKLFDMSRIVIFPEDENMLSVYIFDYINIKPAHRYFEIIHDFERSFGKIFKNIIISFISFKKDRYDKFTKKVENYIKTKERYRNIELKEITKCYYLERIIERTNWEKKEIVEVKQKDKNDFETIKRNLKLDNEKEKGVLNLL